MKMKILNMMNLTHDTTLEEGQLEYNFKRDSITVEEELRYRLWLHYLDCRRGAGKKGVNFSTFKKHTTPMEYVEILRSTLVYTDDIVNVEEISKIFFNWE